MYSVPVSGRWPPRAVKRRILVACQTVFVKAKARAWRTRMFFSAEMAAHIRATARRLRDVQKSATSVTPCKCRAQRIYISRSGVSGMRGTQSTIGSRSKSSISSMSCAVGSRSKRPAESEIDIHAGREPSGLAVRLLTVSPHTRHGHVFDTVPASRSTAWSQRRSRYRRWGTRRMPTTTSTRFVRALRRVPPLSTSGCTAG